MKRPILHTRLWWSGLLCAFCGVLILGSLSLQAVFAQSTNSWFVGQASLTREALVSSGTIPDTVNGTGNISCTETDFILHPAVPDTTAERIESGCAVAMEQGSVAPNGLARLLGHDGKIYDQTGLPAVVYAIPGGKGAVVLERVSSGDRLRYYHDLVGSLRLQQDPVTQTWRYYLTHSGDWVVRDKSGQDLLVEQTSISFSANGQWMVASIPNKAVIAVDLDNNQVAAVAGPFSSDPTRLIWAQTLISNDGRTVVTASYAGDVTLTDVSSCQLTPDYISGPSECTRAFFEPIFRGQVESFQRVQHLRFVNPLTIELYGVQAIDSHRVVARYLWQAAPASPPKSYIALGDSFSSGEGAYAYFNETDTEANRCHLSRQSYPYLIGSRLNVDAVHSVACSGARMQDITTYAQKPRLPTSNGMGRFLPGYQKQVQYLSDSNTDIVTVGIGGNDIGFISKMKACLGAGTCYTSYEDRLEIVKEVSRQFDQLVSTYQQIQNAAGTQAKVYVVGYPQVAEASGSCAINVPLNKAELQLVNQLVDYLDFVIEQSSRRAGLGYVDMKDAFAGHKLCEIDSSQIAMNGVTAGNDIFGIIGNESFHPNRLGHQLFAELILSSTANFTKSVADADVTITRPTSYRGLAMLEAPRTGRPVRELYNFEELAKDVVVRGQPLALQLPLEPKLKPGSIYRVELHSEPLQLGSFTAENQPGITIPRSVAPGYHVLHVIGIDSLDQAVDVYKSVYVGASENDLDGDGITNTLDQCLGNICSQTTQHNQSNRPDPELRRVTNRVAAAHTRPKLHIIRARYHILIGGAVVMCGIGGYIWYRIRRQ